MNGLTAQTAPSSCSSDTRLSYCGLTSYCVSAELLSMTTYVFTACDKHNVKRFSLTSVTETLTGKSWIKRLQNTQSKAAAGRDVNYLKKTPEELSRSDFWRRPRNAFGNGMRGLGKAVRDMGKDLLAQQLEAGWVCSEWVTGKCRSF